MGSQLEPVLSIATDASPASPSATLTAEVLFPDTHASLFTDLESSDPIFP